MGNVQMGGGVHAGEQRPLGEKEKRNRTRKRKEIRRMGEKEKVWKDSLFKKEVDGQKQGVKNENEKIQNNMQPEEKKWTVWRENKGENIVTPSKPSPQEISFPRKSPPSEKQTPSDLTKSPLHSPSPSPKKVPPTPAGGKLKQEIKN